MKKTRFLALLLVASLMLMGAGYAWWNDATTIENTVSTGKLDVTFVQQMTDDCPAEAVPVCTLYQNYYYGNEASSHDNVIDDLNIMQASMGGAINTFQFSRDNETPATGPVDQDKMAIKIRNFYPDAALVANANIKNTGTIPVLLEGISFSADGTDLQWDKIRNYLHVTVTVGLEEITFNMNDIPAATATAGVTNPLSYTTEIPVDGLLPVNVVIHLEEGAPDITEKLGSGFTFTVTPNFKQFNDTL